MRRPLLIAVLAVALVVGACSDDDDAAAPPSATPPQACVEAVSGFPDNGTSMVERCEHLRDVLAASAAGGQPLTAGEAAIAVRALCQDRAGEAGWETATPLCAEVAEVFAAADEGG